jgi:xylulokinase
VALVAGVDSSTQSTKVELRHLDSGARVWAGSRPHPPTTPPRSEQDPAAWWAALHPLLDEAWAAAGSQGDQVVAVSVAAQQHGMVVLDRAGRVLRPAKLWNDTEAEPDAERLVAALGGPARCARLTGSVIGPAFTAAKLAWLRRCEPQVAARVATVCLPHDWLTSRLSGRVVTDAGDASGTGYYDPAARQWVDEVLDQLGLARGALPPVLGPAEAAGQVGPVLVAPGTGDNMAAALGAALAPGDLALSLGTSGTAFRRTGHPTADASGAVAGFADATGQFLPLVCTLNAMKVAGAVSRLLGVVRERFDQLALECGPGAGGVVLLPYLDGERTPARPRATGVLTGLRSDLTPAQVARATVEGVVCSLLDGVDALDRALATTGDAGRVVLTGGGARSPAFRRVVADLLGRPVTVPEADELVAAGAAVQAAAVLQGAPPEEVARRWGLHRGVEVEPDPAVDRRAVRAAYARVRDAAGS